MKLAHLMVIVALISSLVGCANTSRVSHKSVKSKIKISKQAETPNSTDLAVYIPENKRKLEFFANGTLHRPGKALQDSLVEAFAPYFPSTTAIDKEQPEKKFGLLLDLEPDWDLKNLKAHATIKYKVFTPDGQLLSSGEVSGKADINYSHTDAAFFNSSFKALKTLAIKVLNKHLPTADKYPSTGEIANFDAELLINDEKPISSGTAFLINEQGDFLTSNHVIDRCLVTRLKFKDNVVDAQLHNSSRLLDLAVLQSDVKDKDFLPLRKQEQVNLGEKVVSVSYPLKGVLASSANLTLGNVTSKKALEGSLGLFQFSAPIQPGSSGGAIVAENGEVIGVVTSTLNAKSLIKKGVVPQNINFALNGRYVTKFLDTHEITYDVGQSEAAEQVNERALASTAQVVCYQ